ncbi:Predicted ATPase [Nannocystis exedens]|uniref:histidine kinase n=1 Tax=Nannocystis exedens TaxID=54 RepID=A0A1I1U9B1_9BACT|nr:AAA family ATPase [Nannocystis exedens]PCC71514.1 ATPase AAA [Nannocystis exedens]SFD67225.1 Predicted ATPase [Nannocystis exedens]
MSHYLVVEHLHDGAVFSLDRALDTTDNRPVVLKRLPAARSDPHERGRLRREYEILQRLDLPGVVRARALEEEDGELRLVLLDFGGHTLDARLRRGPLALAEFFDLAVQLADIVDAVHRRGVLHKDIKPRNILVDHAGQVQVIDFGIASEVPRELAVASPPRVLEGTLAYIAPEQTGRMNRPVDSRSDLYSLGATFYEMLTGAPPFAGHDPVELVHGHIARAPRPPGELAAGVPDVLSDIVLKLLAKQADDRYQSASGLRHDLERCRERVRAGEAPTRFQLATRDAPARFELPARLYGREAAAAELSRAYARVGAGAAELLLVAGPPGIGKSALVHELDREIAGRGGRMIAGKFEQLRRDQPYSALRAAFAQLVEGMLADSEEGLARRTLALERELGRLAGALLTLLPELRPALPRAGAASADGDSPGAARGRLHRAVRAFVRAFADPAAPLVLLLDDLQWADSASLELLGALLTGESTPGLLVIATVRDEAVTPLLQSTLEALAEVSHRIDLRPLTQGDTQALLADALRRAPAEVASLAALVHDRTGGVPLLVGAYLRDLAHHDLIAFDRERARFVWDEAAIAGAAVSADVVTVMVERTRSLGQATREALGRAACVGGEFDAALLADLTGRPEPEVTAALVEAARSGLIVACGGRWRFFHDRVQQAVESLLAVGERAAIHLALARRLRGGDAVDERHPRLFEIADHFNAAAGQVEDAGERRALAEIDLAAARQARASGAFAATTAYAAAGAAWLAPIAADAPQTAFALDLLRAEGLFLTGEHAAAEAILAALLERAREPRERALACELWATLDLHLGRLEACVDRGLVGLRAIGFDSPRRTGLPGVMVEFMRTKSAIAGRSPTTLADLPPLRDPTVKLALRIYFVIIGAVYQFDMMTMMAMTMRATRLSLQHGTSSLSAAQFLSYGMLLAIVQRDAKIADDYGRFALEMLARYPDRGVEAVVKFLYGAMIQPWKHAFTRSLPILREGLQAGLDSGQLMYAGLCASTLVSTRMQAGSPLEQVRLDLESGLALARAAHVASAITHLQTGAAAFTALTGVALEVGPADPKHEADYMVTLSRAVQGAQLHFIFGRIDEGLADSDRAEPRAARELGQAPLYADHVFFRALLLARRGPAPGPIGALRLRRALQSAADKLDAWSRGCPANFEARAHLVRAELHRVAGDGAAALQRYEAALAAAVRHARPHDEGVACEVAAHHFARAGLRDAQHVYLRRARRAYLRWGALAKVRALDQHHPGLDRRGHDPDLDASLPPRATDLPSRTSSSEPTLSRGGQHLDFATLFKATQVFADELDLGRLLAAVMRLLVEDSGAERGVLLLARGAGLVGAHMYVAEGDRHTPLGDVPLAELAVVPEAVAILAHRSGRPLVVDDAEDDPRFAADPYVRRVRPRSLLAAPLVHGGERLGVLYLENNLVAAAFSPERSETLRLLAVQAAIAIDRALLFGRLEDARRAAEAASEAKTRFLANMSHELRTPLNAILGYCEMLSEEADERGYDGMLADLDKIRRAGGHLLAIVRDILDLTKIEAGRIEPAREPIDVDSLLRDVVTMALPDLTRGDNRLVCDFAADLGVMLGDPTLVRQILVNLLGNAAKFTARGEVTLRAVRSARQVRFVVEDTGIGMTAAELATAFEPFVQADTSSTRRFDGVGLGLTICRRLAEAMGGSLTASSEPGRGSAFTLELPTG